MNMFAGVRVNRLTGFLLFEVLVAILVASTALVIVMQGVGGALRGSNISANYFKASVLAEAQVVLLEKENGVKLGYSGGRFTTEEDQDGIFSYTKTITQVRTSTLLETTELPICEVKLTVSWKERPSERSFTLIIYLPKYEESPAER